MTHINIISSIDVDYFQFRKVYYLNKGYYCNFGQLRHIFDTCVRLNIYYNYGKMNYKVSRVQYDNYDLAHIKSHIDNEGIKPFYENIAQYMIANEYIRGQIG